MISSTFLGEIDFQQTIMKQKKTLVVARNEFHRSTRIAFFNAWTMEMKRFGNTGAQYGVGPNPRAFIGSKPTMTSSRTNEMLYPTPPSR